MGKDIRYFMYFLSSTIFVMHNSYFYSKVYVVFVIKKYFTLLILLLAALSVVLAVIPNVTSPPSCRLSQVFQLI